jgi:hypothetical protein
MDIWRKRHLSMRIHSLNLVLAIGLAITFSLVPGSAWAATRTVTNPNDSGTGSLRQALSQAASGDTITFDPSLNGKTIMLTSGALSVMKKVTIVGPGADQLTISGGGKSRVLIVNSGANVTIKGMTIANGYVKNMQGAGIYSMGTLTLDHVVVTNNVLASLSLGGVGIYNRGSLTVTFSTIQNNRDSTYSFGGGGIFNDGTLSLQDSQVSGNQVHSQQLFGMYGGGGVCNRGTATILRSVISGNTAAGYTYGGGAGIYNSAKMTITDSQVQNNTAAQTFGGGILNWSGGTLVIERSTISGNQSGQDGAGIEDVGTLTLRTSTISGNASAGAAYGGGGLDVTSGTAAVINSTISGNTSPKQGAGIYNTDGTVTLSFSTVSGNTAQSGSGLYTEQSSKGTAVTTLSNVVLAENSGGDCKVSGGTVSTTAALIGDGSCSATLSGDPLLGPLQNNGGPTQTQALLAGSPAIDQAICDSGISTDQRGLPRPFDFPEITNAGGGLGCDLGGYELQP